MDLKNFNFYKDFVNIMNFYMRIFQEKGIDTDWYYNETDVYHIKYLYVNSLKNIAQKHTDYYERLYDTNYYSSLYDPQFKRSKISGERRNKSIYTDMNIKYVKGRLCKAKQIKLSQTKNEKRVVYNKIKKKKDNIADIGL